MSSEGTVRNSAGDTVKMELMDILRGDYIADHVSIWYYRLDDIEGSSRSKHVAKSPTKHSVKQFHMRNISRGTLSVPKKPHQLGTIFLL